MERASSYELLSRISLARSPCAKIESTRPKPCWREVLAKAPGMKHRPASETPPRTNEIQISRAVRAACRTKLEPSERSGRVRHWGAQTGAREVAIRVCAEPSVLGSESPLGEPTIGADLLRWLRDDLGQPFLVRAERFRESVNNPQFDQ